MKMSSKIIAVLGATGTQGASVVDTFAADPDWHVRAVTRDVNSTKAKELQARHPQIDIVQADANDPKSLRRAFSGVAAIFAVTDYWAPFNDPKMRERHATGSNPADSLRRWAYDEEIRLGKNIADAAASVLASEGVLERFIWSSLPSPKKYSGGKYEHIYHFESKAVVEEYVNTEQAELSTVMNVLFVGFYVSNMLLLELMRPVKRPDGSFLVQRLCEEDAKHPFVLTRQDTGMFVKALVEQASGKRLLEYTAMLSWGEMSQLWGKVLGQHVQFRTVSLDEFKKKYPVDGEEILSANYSAEFGYAGRDPEVLGPSDVGIKERPQDIEKWFGEQDWSVVLDADPDVTV